MRKRHLRKSGLSLTLTISNSGVDLVHWLQCEDGTFLHTEDTQFISTES